MRKLFSHTLTVAVFFYSALSAGQRSQDQIRSIKLLDSDIGWAATEHSLFWTTDGGRSWGDVTPKTSRAEEIRSVFFLDASRGWALLVRGDKSTGNATFDLATTASAGKTWSVGPARIPDLDPERATLSGEGTIDFVDSMHGWMNLGLVSGANFRLGTLLVTTDGGRTWNWATKGPGVYGQIRFTTLKDGWIAGGPGNQELLTTHDGSTTWQKVQLPSNANDLTRAIFEQTPIFVDENRGFLPVTFSNLGNTSTRLALFATTDAGKTWKEDRSLPIADHAFEVVPSTMAGPTWMIAPSDRGLSLRVFEPGGVPATLGVSFAPTDSATLQLSFATKTRGWVLTSRGLFATTDGGASWENITPSGSRISSTQISQTPDRWASVNEAPSDEPPSSSGSGTSMHLGFHECEAPTISQLTNWWTSSPYFDVGIYIGGASRSCPNGNLTSSWITQAQNQGWGPNAAVAWTTGTVCVLASGPTSMRGLPARFQLQCDDGLCERCHRGDERH